MRCCGRDRGAAATTGHLAAIVTGGIAAAVALPAQSATAAGEMVGLATIQMHLVLDLSVVYDL